MYLSDSNTNSNTSDLQEPLFITGKKELVATLTFRPFTRFKKSKDNIIQKEYRECLPISTLNKYISAERSRSSFVGREFVRNWVEHGKEIGLKFLEDNSIDPPMLDWVSIILVVQWGDYKKRDITNQ